MTLTEEIMHAAFTSSDDRKRDALLVLRGEATTQRNGGRRNLRSESEPFVELGAVAEFLGVSRRSVWRWNVPAHHFGTRTRFKLSEVEAYVGSEAFKKRMAVLKELRQQEDRL